MGGINIPPVAGMKNRIINGNMRFAQRGTSFVVPSYAYALDRWVYRGGHDAGNITITQDLGVFPNNNFQASLKMTNAAGTDPAIGASQFCFVSQIVEGYNIVPLRSGKMTLSFWVYSNKTGTYCVSFRNAGYDRSYVCEYTIDVANTWEYKAVFCDLSAVFGGTWNYTNGVGLMVDFVLAMGSAYQTTKDAWQNGLYLATASQVNWLNDLNNTFYIVGAQLEKGSAPTEFEYHDYGAERALCQRYYWQQTYENSFVELVCTDYDGTDHYTGLLNPVTMRTYPVGYYSNLAHFTVYEAGASLGNPTALVYVGASPVRGHWKATRAGGTAGRASLLVIETASGWLSCDAEL